jgi:DNA modification methylase
MGYDYTGVDIRQEQIDENLKTLDAMALRNVHYICGDGCLLTDVDGIFDIAITCPPYYDLEVYSDLPGDISNLKSYDLFNEQMAICAKSHDRVLRPGAFVCIVVNNFRDKKGELVDFRSDTVGNFKRAGFKFWQEIIISKNFASAAKRASMSWKGMKLVTCHEHLLVFRKPEVK